MRDRALTILPRPRAASPIRRRLLQRGAALAGLTLLSGCSSLPQIGGKPAGPRRIATLRLNNPIAGSWLDAWEQRLGELGYVDGQNIVIERPVVEANDQFGALVADLIGRKVELFVAAGWAA